MESLLQQTHLSIVHRVHQLVKNDTAPGGCEVDPNTPRPGGCQEHLYMDFRRAGRLHHPTAHMMRQVTPAQAKGTQHKLGLTGTIGGEKIRDAIEAAGF